MNRAARVLLAFWLIAATLGAGEQSTQSPGGEPPEFVPTEKVPTDSAVAFPVDI